MNRSILGRTACSTAVALALGFGLQEAVASPPAEARRPYCEDQFHCEQTCELIYGPGTPGTCSSGNTCYCIR